MTAIMQVEAKYLNMRIDPVPFLKGLEEVKFEQMYLGGAKTHFAFRVD